MKMIKVYKYRIRPNYLQSLLLNDYMETCRWLYNKVLDKYIHDYDYAKNNFYFIRNQYPYLYDKFICDNNITKIKIPNEFYEYGGRIRDQGKGDMSSYKYYVYLRNHCPIYYENLNNMPAVICQDVLSRVENAYKKFWSGGGYPKFKRRGSVNSITWTQSPPFNNIKISNNKLVLPKFGKIPIIYHRSFNGIIKRVNITKSSLGEYYANIFVEYDEEPKKSIGKIASIDRNIKLDDEKLHREFMTLFDGNKSILYTMPTYLRELNKQLKKTQRQLSKHEKGSSQWLKLMQRERHIWDKINNRKKNWIEVLTTEISKSYDKIVIEKLEIKNSLMSKEKHKIKAAKKGSKSSENIELTRAKQSRRGFGEVSHTMFLIRLKQKMGDENIIEVDPAYTSMDCSQCGYRNYQLKLSDREWICPSCKTIHIRDSNAAINIYKKGIDIISK